MEKVIVHIDLNAFFVQCEVLRNPSLKGKVVAVGYDSSRSVISTSSYEARKMGVYSGMPVSIAKSKCPDLILLDCDFLLYKDYSNAFFSYLKKKYPILEKASIDECYIDMTKEADVPHLNDYLFQLQLELFKATSLKCSIGCSFNKFLAKMASDLKKPLGLTIFTRQNFQSQIFPLDIDKMFGIGKKTAPKLKSCGINTIGDLHLNDSLEVRKILGNSYPVFKDLLNGIGDDNVNSSPFDPKSISAERTFSEENNDYEQILQMVASCCLQVTKELTRYKKSCLSVGIKLRDNAFVTKSKRLTLDKPTDSYQVIYNAASNLLESLFKNSQIRLVGVMLDKVVDKGADCKKERVMFDFDGVK